MITFLMLVLRKDIFHGFTATENHTYLVLEISWEGNWQTAANLQTTQIWLSNDKVMDSKVA